jgi:DNA-binding response OmpR family regulator
MVLDSSKYQVTLGSTAIDFPGKQFELIFTLCTNPGQIFTRDSLIEKIWGLDYEGDDRTVDTHIKRIRKQLEPFEHVVKIVTVRGLGYKVEIST